MDTKDKEQPTAQRINKFIEKFSVWIVSILISIGGYMYTKIDDKLETLEERVAYLYQDKVSRQELKEEMSLLRNSQNQMKDDIVQRLELILRMLPANRE